MTDVLTMYCGDCGKTVAEAQDCERCERILAEVRAYDEAEAQARHNADLAAMDRWARLTNKERDDEIRRAM